LFFLDNVVKRYAHLNNDIIFAVQKNTKTITAMFETFKSMDGMLQVYWILAAVSSIIFIIQAIMTFIGFDADSDVDMSTAPDQIPESGDAAFDAAGFHLVSVKSVICFILGFGWTGVLCWNYIPNHVLLGLLAAVVGLIFMSLIAFLLFQMMKLNRDNTFRVEQTIGLPADVYLRIPGNRKQTGKITVSLNGSTHELEALSDTDIPTGAKVRIKEIVQGETVLVEKI
jgi:membrane protein implicated in regulation of membrane protease activity